MNNVVYAADTKETQVNTGIDKKDREALAKSLGPVLASTYVLYHKTHAYHWNVTGPLFYSVHKLTDDQYQDMADAIDDIAERIRALGFTTPVGLGSYISDSVVEDVKSLPTAGEMIQELSEDHQKIAAQLRKVVEEAEDMEDVYTADLLTTRIGVHEEAAWMLNALMAQ